MERTHVPWAGSEALGSELLLLLRGPWLGESQPLKIETLCFLRQMMASGVPAAFQPHVKTLSAAVFTAAGERYYKVWTLGGREQYEGPGGYKVQAARDTATHLH